MSKSIEEINAKKQFAQMPMKKKIGYIYDYYKWYIILAIIFVIILGSSLHRYFTQKETILYLAFVNVSIGEDLEEKLKDNYFEYVNEDSQKEEIEIYKNLYVSDDPSDENHQFAYASRMKTLASINAKQLDLVLLNKEAYEIFLKSEYLLDLSTILKDQTQETYSLIANDMPIFKNAGFNDTLYIGVIANSPRLDRIKSYIDYLNAE